MSEAATTTLPADLADALDRFTADDGAALLVALDFDGVLAPLVDDPAASRMAPSTRAAVDLLGALTVPDGGAAAGRARLAFVSGRDLEDLAARAEPPAGTYLVGSHGAQTGHVRPDGVLEAVPLELTPEQAAALEALYDALEEAAAGREGVWVQRKPSAGVLHTRTAGPEDSAAAEALADAAAARLGLDAMHGKDVVEIAVLPTSKGEALTRLRTVVGQETGAGQVRVLYAGDDTTDEKAFAALGAGDVTIKVGAGETVATYRVPGIDAVAAALDRVRSRLA
ncbi:trehalose-phosphatase [Isoptericola variabilis]|uniref:Trehalose 6-phosphate phosphatase n=1 Tax=Isoptericola variabilis (strain 225) TaxID=743718 RepID=F6FTV1_ISOV2|nr:trehalose-phosphatase [Isoptericola variabilis]AEG45322.1 trehalose-phosphatase [Isoptericola variabilis 225]TWH34825.1 trehalose 6-phosphate phosphatase/trehalose 6-phosphate synthase/phosphatase [Isoptericola variabilis J7]